MAFIKPANPKPPPEIKYNVSELATFIHENITRYNFSLEKGTNMFNLNSTNYIESIFATSCMHFIWLLAVTVALLLLFCIIRRLFKFRKRKVMRNECINRCPKKSVWATLMLIGCLLLLAFVIIYEAHIHTFMQTRMTRRDTITPSRFSESHLYYWNEYLRCTVMILIYILLLFWIGFTIYVVRLQCPYSYWCFLYVILVHATIAAVLLTAEALFFSDACQSLETAAKYIKPPFDPKNAWESYGTREVVFTVCYRDNILLRVTAQLVAMLLLAFIIIAMLIIYIIIRRYPVKSKSSLYFVKALYVCYKRRRIFAKYRRQKGEGCHPCCPDDKFQPCWSTTPINRKLYNKCCAKSSRASKEYKQEYKRKMDLADIVYDPKCLPCLGTCESEKEITNRNVKESNIRVEVPLQQTAAPNQLKTDVHRQQSLNQIKGVSVMQMAYDSLTSLNTSSKALKENDTGRNDVGKNDPGRSGQGMMSTKSDINKPTAKTYLISPSASCMINPMPPPRVCVPNQRPPQPNVSQPCDLSRLPSIYGRDRRSPRKKCPIQQNSNKTECTQPRGSPPRSYTPPKPCEDPQDSEDIGRSMDDAVPEAFSSPSKNLSPSKSDDNLRAEKRPPPLCLDLKMHAQSKYPCEFKPCQKLGDTLNWSESFLRDTSCHNIRKTCDNAKKICRPTGYYSPPPFHIPPKVYPSPSLNASKRLKPKYKSKSKDMINFPSTSCSSCQFPERRRMKSNPPCKFSNRAMPCESPCEKPCVKTKKSKKEVAKFNPNCPANPFAPGRMGYCGGSRNLIRMHNDTPCMSKPHTGVVKSIKDCKIARKALLEAHKRKTGIPLEAWTPCFTTPPCGVVKKPKKKEKKAKLLCSTAVLIRQDMSTSPLTGSMQCSTYERPVCHLPANRQKILRRSNNCPSITFIPDCPDVIPYPKAVNQYPDVITQCPQKYPSYPPNAPDISGYSYPSTSSERPNVSRTDTQPNYFPYPTEIYEPLSTSCTYLCTSPVQCESSLLLTKPGSPCYNQNQPSMCHSNQSSGLNNKSLSKHFKQDKNKKQKGTNNKTAKKQCKSAPSSQSRPTFVTTNSSNRTPTSNQKRTKIFFRGSKGSSLRENNSLQNEILESYSNFQFMSQYLSTHNSSYHQLRNTSKPRTIISKLKSQKKKSSKDQKRSKRSFINAKSSITIITPTRRPHPSNGFQKPVPSILKNSRNRDQIFYVHQDGQLHHAGTFASQGPNIKVPRNVSTRIRTGREAKCKQHNNYFQISDIKQWSTEVLTDTMSYAPFTTYTAKGDKIKHSITRGISRDARRVSAPDNNTEFILNRVTNVVKLETNNFVNLNFSKDSRQKIAKFSSKPHDLTVLTTESPNRKPALNTRKTTRSKLKSFTSIFDVSTRCNKNCLKSINLEPWPSRQVLKLNYHTIQNIRPEVNIENRKLNIEKEESVKELTPIHDATVLGVTNLQYLPDTVPRMSPIKQTALYVQKNKIQFDETSIEDSVTESMINETREIQMDPQRTVVEPSLTETTTNEIATLQLNPENKNTPNSQLKILRKNKRQHRR